MVKSGETDMYPDWINRQKRGGAYYSDAACNLIHAIYNDSGDIQPVNTRNNGAIGSIPADSAVEINCVITKDGPKPIAADDLPFFPALKAN
jgi:6-phospho-beta-glucosidase